MIGQERSDHSFEDQWREAFEGEAVTPPDHVWSEIDRKLAYSELVVYKSRAVFYKWSAAAVIFIALGLGLLQYWYLQGEYENALAINRIIIDRQMPALQPGMKMFESGDKVFPDKSQVSDQKAGSDQYQLANSTTEMFAFSSSESNKSRVNKDGMFALRDSESNDISQNFSNSVVIDILDSASKSESKIAASTVEMDKKAFEFWIVQPITDLTASNELIVVINEPKKLPVYHYELMKSAARVSDKKYYAGLNYGNGGFNPNFESAGNSLLSNNLAINPAAYSQSSNEALDAKAPSVREGMSPGGSVSLGLNFGWSMSDRWVFEGGLQYARTDAVTETNMVIQTSSWNESIPATSQVSNNAQFKSAVMKEEVVEYEYRDVRLSNQFQFTSIPLKAGYILVNSKLRVELNAGVITNVYLGNKLTGTDQEIAAVTIGPGKESPYRDVSFSGLAGVEFGYRLLRKFDVILEPNYRKALNSLTKDGSEFVSNPSGFGVLTGVRYNFN